jgi:inorganic pyrophosphatase
MAARSRETDTGEGICNPIGRLSGDRRCCTLAKMAAAMLFTVSLKPIDVNVVIEIPRASFLKRGSTGHVDFVSPLPCPFNYGAVPNYIGLEGDLLDAVVLGPRIAYGGRVRTKAWFAITLTDRGMSDDKLICSKDRPTSSQCRNVLRFFHFYAKCKGLLNVWRGRPGRNACEGYCEVHSAFARARPRDDTWHGPTVDF